MKTLMQFILLQLVCLSLQSQTTFQKTYGAASTDELGYDVKTMADGGALLLNNVTNPVSESFDIQLLRIDAQGNMVWEKNFPTSGSESNLELMEHPSGDCIIRANILEEDGQRKFLLKRVKPDSGDEVWSNLYDNQSGILMDFAVRENGDIVLLLLGENILFTVSESSGEIKDTILINTFTIADTDIRSLESINVTADAGFIFAGTVYNFETDTEDMLLLKTDSNGLEEWATVVSSVEENDDGEDSGGYAFETKDGNYVIVGQTDDFYDLIVKVNATGTVVWKNERNVQSFLESTVLWKGFESTEGNLIFGSSTDTDIYIVSVNPDSGETNWTQTIDYGRIDFFYSMVENLDGDIWIAGATNSFNGTGNDILLTTISIEGGALDTRTYGQDGNRSSDIGTSIAISSDNEYMIFGATNSCLTILYHAINQN